jgi:hypothetical protein
MLASTHVDQGFLDFAQVDFAVVGTAGNDWFIRMEAHFIHCSFMAWQLVSTNEKERTKRSFEIKTRKDANRIE